MLAVSHLLLINTIIASLSHPVLGSSLLGLDQQQRQTLRDRLFQTNLRGPRWTGNDNQNVLLDLVTGSMDLAGLKTETLDYTLNRWDPRWWSLNLQLTNGTNISVPTTGFWPYSGDSGLAGVTAPIHDAGTYGLSAIERANTSTLDLENLPEGGSIIFFDNPSPTRNYSLPGYHVLGTSRNILPEDIPELGNLSNPHWQSEKKLKFDKLADLGVKGMISSWVHTSDENAALQFLPNAGAPGNGNLYNVPSLYVGNSTGELIRKMVSNGEVKTATIVLDAPSYEAPTKTVIGYLPGLAGRDESLLLYTHSDGPSIIEENGPLLLLTLAEYFAKNPLNISLDIVMTTGHMSGGHLDEKLWMDQRPEIRDRAKAAIICEHFGAIEWKDVWRDGVPVYEPTGRLEPMWTMVSDKPSEEQELLHNLYIDAFDGTPDWLRMAMVSPQRVGGIKYRWYGAGGSSYLGRKGDLPTVGIIPQPDYLWAAMSDGGWSKLDMDMVVSQIDVIIRLVTSLNDKYSAGQL
ncbi:hypothetical protein AGABI1DRAFT_131498 [Agaricus bisporus var. burnettii JB137-S8]|uniref:Uncharacterized protein n=2 Tax=Agaricus bisporus var. burnettii TaxID=192524 RepID=K5WZC6_AGABU|nr:uncharacterized protein AGABI1DRAFT_131498 [Agaricus bisporus var. burnettii JB137-S8]EKM76178.1 hypothetical protein AGABI1DRAFT_131498 [Agaricus bisporus var. burnettii JB137-S8]KAF7759807.1 hypothetical protein Agabi119p4_11502 [Agaricus bisporus var. burnettii]